MNDGTRVASLSMESALVRTTGRFETLAPDDGVPAFAVAGHHVPAATLTATDIPRKASDGPMKLPVTAMT